MEFPKEWVKKNRYYLIGMWFFLLQLLVFHQNLFVLEYYTFLWFCDHSPLIFAIAFFTKNKSAIKGLINFGFLVQIVWVADFLVRLFTGFSAFAYTHNLFSADVGWFVLSPLLVHALSVNIAFFYTYKVKPTNKALYYAMGYIFVIWAFSLIFSPVEINVNCVQSMCGLENFSIPGWTYLWPLIAVLILVLPTHIIQRLAYKHHKDEKDIDLLIEHPGKKEVILEYGED